MTAPASPPVAGVDVERLMDAEFAKDWRTWSDERARLLLGVGPRLDAFLAVREALASPVSGDGSSLRDTHRAAEGAVLDRLATAEAELKRLRDAKWSDMSDEELGRCFKAFAEQVEAQSGKEWSGDSEMRLGLMNMGLQQAIKMAAESNAETFTYTAEGFHSAGVKLGDWRVVIERVPPPTAASVSPGMETLQASECTNPNGNGEGEQCPTCRGQSPQFCSDAFHIIPQGAEANQEDGR